MKRLFTFKISVLIALLFIAVIFGITKGSVDLRLAELFSIENRTILYLRLARILLAVVAGGGLAVSGIVLQAILRNPLAEPYLLGTSGGAGLGAVIAIGAGVSAAYLPFAAFIGAIVSIILVYNLARQGARIPTQSLILSGVIVSLASSSIIAFLISLSPSEAIHGVTWWLWGSLEVFNFRLLFLVSAITAVCVLAISVFSQDLNAISLGEEEAVHLGIDIEKVKKLLFILVSLMTASLICISGIIGFVGLIIPHMMRAVVGPNHRILVPASVLSAAAFMVVCDVFARTLFSPIEIPIGVITALIGAPIFVVLLKKAQRVR